MTRTCALALAAAVCATSVLRADAQLVVSANDAKVTLVDGVQTIVPKPGPDTVTILDFGALPPRVVGELAAPVSIFGPPSSVAISPDGSLALVTAAMKLDPSNPAQLVPDNRVSVISLAGGRPAVLATVSAGPAPSGIAINRAGTLALVANRGDGTVSVLTIKGTAVANAGSVDLGAPASIPSGIVFAPDGRRAFVTRNGDSLVSVLDIDQANRVTYAKKDFGAGSKPYPIEITPAGDLAVIGHVGAGATGGTDLISLIDLSGPVPRAIDHVPAGPVVEGLAMSADGRHVAATVMNGSNAPRSAAYFSDSGRLRVFRIDKRSLVPVADTRVGRWCQGVVWNRGGDALAVQCTIERELQFFRFDGQTLRPAGVLGVNGGPVGIRAQP